MERLTNLIGFEARYIVYPILVLLVGVCARFIVKHYLHRWANRTQNKLDDKIIGYLESLITPLILVSVLYWISGLLPLSAKSAGSLQKGLIVVAVFLVAFYSAKLISSLVLLLGEQRESWQKLLQPVRTLSNVLFALAAAALSLKILNVNLTDEGVRLVRIIGIIAGAYVVIRIVNLAVRQFEHFVENNKAVSGSEAQKRARTIGKIINNSALVIVVSVAVMMVLSEFGINITPIITGAGIAGLAVGFGAQNLVRDVISGFFLILEDQIRVGDVAKINGIGGLVEAIKLRTTILRDLEGVVHIFPNGEISQVSNMTKEFSYYVINVGVAYKENVDEVMEVLRQIGAELEKDPKFVSLILAPLEILGVDDFSDSQITIKIRIKTLPLQQWAVGRELRRRIKNTFDSRNIEIPFPHLSVYFGEASKPFDVALRSLAGDSNEELVQHNR